MCKREGEGGRGGGEWKVTSSPVLTFRTTKGVPTKGHKTTHSPQHMHGCGSRKGDGARPQRAVTTQRLAAMNQRLAASVQPLNGQHPQHPWHHRTPQNHSHLQPLTRVPPPISSTDRREDVRTPWLSHSNNNSVAMLRNFSSSPAQASSSCPAVTSHRMSRSTPSGHATFSTSTVVTGTVPNTCREQHEVEG
jgi:hypothetical protein